MKSNVFQATFKLNFFLYRHVSFFVVLMAIGFAPAALILLVAMFYHAPWDRFKRLLLCGRQPAPENSNPFSEAEETSPISSHMELYRESGSAIRLCLFLTLLSYPSVTGVIAQFFSCRKVENSWYLSADLSVTYV